MYCCPLLQRGSPRLGELEYLAEVLRLASSRARIPAVVWSGPEGWLLYTAAHGIGDRGGAYQTGPDKQAPETRG